MTTRFPVDASARRAVVLLPRLAVVISSTRTGHASSADRTAIAFRHFHASTVGRDVALHRAAERDVSLASTGSALVRLPRVTLDVLFAVVLTRRFAFLNAMKPGAAAARRPAAGSQDFQALGCRTLDRHARGRQAGATLWPEATSVQ